MYVKNIDGEILVISLHVDDLLLLRSSSKQIENFKKEMREVFEMTNLRRTIFFIGIQVYQNQNEIFLYKEKMKISSQEV